MAKLTRAQIREGLEQVPMDVLLVGNSVAKDKKLTPKQREFARQIALGESKAGAYRKAYNSEGKPATQSRKGQELAKRDTIQAQIEAFQVALEAERIRTPAALRALVITKLTEKALDPEIKPAQQLKALELLGKVTEVAAFTERREVIQTKAPDEIKARLMETLRLAMRADAEDTPFTDGDSLLAELAEAADPAVIESEPEPTPPHPHPPEAV